MGKYFGTDGFRGEANIGLTADVAYKIGRFLGYYYGRDRRCRAVIGKDTRRSGYMLEYALVAGLCASGADAYLLHVTTTPSVSYVVRTEGFDLGIMISASHNPYYDNGIKLIGSKGEKLCDEVIGLVESYLDGECGELPYAKREHIGRTVDYVEGRNRYTGYLISLARDSYKGIKVGLDASNGSAWMLAKDVFDALGARTYVMNARPNGFNINDGCGSTHMGGLCELVVREGLDVGFAYDGDADRCLAVDEDGRVIDGDGIMYSAARYMKDKGDLHKNTLVATVMSNMGLDVALKKEGISIVRTNVGDRFVYEAMQDGGYSLGGEESGHIIFSKYATTGDGIITSIKIMEMLMASGAPASRLTSGYAPYAHLLVNIPVTDRDGAVCDPMVVLAARQAEEMLCGRGRLLLRKSGTEPVVRVMAEAESKELCRAAAEKVAEAIRATKFGKTAT